MFKKKTLSVYVVGYCPETRSGVPGSPKLDLRAHAVRRDAWRDPIDGTPRTVCNRVVVQATTLSWNASAQDVCPECRRQVQNSQT
jgi:hypothetical protein